MMPDREKVISKLEKEVQRTYSTKTTVFQNGEKVSEEINTHREPFVRIPIEMADKILALLKEQEAVEPIPLTDEMGMNPPYMCGDCLCRVCARNECGDNYVEGIDNDCLGCNGCNGTVDLLEDCPKEAFVPDDE